MELRAAGLQEQPFRSHGRPLVFVNNAAQEAAFDFLQSNYVHFSGFCLFQGPPLSGKSTILRKFAEIQRERSAVAVVDCTDMNATQFLEALLTDFGFEHKFSSDNELINMVKVFILQQTASGKPPYLIAENVHEMNPAVLRVIADLCKERVREKFALKLAFSSDRAISYVPDTPGMEHIAKRLSGDFHLAPLTQAETSDYLYSKMRSGGCFDPENVFPEEVCDELHDASGGWPGIVDRLALLALAKAEYCPIKAEHIERPTIPSSTQELAGDNGALDSSADIEPPTLYLTKNGRTIKKIVFEGERLLVGRSRHNDLPIDSSFVSRHHALFVRHGKATLLMDLNSSNGTFVNSRRISNQVMINDDVITIGHHGIKFVDPEATNRAELEGIGFSDTVVMKSLEDMRRILTRENTRMLPVADKAKASSLDAD